MEDRQPRDGNGDDRQRVLTSDRTSSIELERSTIRKVSLHLLPLLGLIYLVAYIDRQNVSFAKLQMTGDLGLSEASFGLGASLFFLGYFVFEVPSNLIMVRVGAAVWFARIMASWGLVTMLLAFTPNGLAFFVLRFCLGAAEAGLFPGVLYVLTLWFPISHRGRAIGFFMIAGATANAIGAAAAGLLLDLEGTYGLHGWQWLFLVTGFPAIALAPLTLARLPRDPDTAPWLSSSERKWLENGLASESVVTAAESSRGLRALRDPKVYLLSLTYVGYPLAAYGLSYWLPTIIRDLGANNVVNGLLNAALWTFVAIGLWLIPRHASRRQDQRWHLLLPPLVGAFALVGSVVLTVPSAKFASLCVAATAIYAGQPIFWTLPSRFLRASGAAAGFAAINSVGNLGGFLAQAAVPRVAAAYASVVAPMFLLAGALLVVAVGSWLAERLLKHPTTAD